MKYSYFENAGLFRQGRPVNNSSGGGGAGPGEGGEDGAETVDAGAEAQQATPDAANAELSAKIANLRSSLQTYENDANPEIKKLAKDADDKLKSVEKSDSDLSEADMKGVINNVENILTEAGQRREFEDKKGQIDFLATRAKENVSPMFEKTLEQYGDLSEETGNKMKALMETAMTAQEGAIDSQSAIAGNLQFDAASFGNLNTQLDDIKNKMEGKDPALSNELINIYNNYLAQRDALAYAEYGQDISDSQARVGAEINVAQITIQQDIYDKTGKFDQPGLKIQALDKLGQQASADLAGLTKPEDKDKRVLVLAHMKDEINKLMEANTDNKVGDLVIDQHDKDQKATQKDALTKLEELRNTSGALQQKLANSGGESAPPELKSQADAALQAFKDQKVKCDNMGQGDPSYQKIIDNIKADEGLIRPMTEPGYESITTARATKSKETPAVVAPDRIALVSAENSIAIDLLNSGSGTKIEVNGVKVDFAKQPSGYFVNGRVFTEVNDAYAEVIKVADAENTARAIVTGAPVRMGTTVGYVEPAPAPIVEQAPADAPQPVVTLNPTITPTLG